MYEFKHPPQTAIKAQANQPAGGERQQPQAAVQQQNGRAVTVLKFCRCADCRQYETCPIGSDEPNHWRYCAMYRGPQLTQEQLTWPNPASY